MQPWKVIGTAVFVLGCLVPKAVGSELPPPASGSFWSLRSPVSDQERGQLVDRAAGRDANEAFSGPMLTTLVSSRESFKFTTGQEQEYFVNPEPSSMLVWATTTMGLLAAGYGYRRRTQ